MGVAAASVAMASMDSSSSVASMVSIGTLAGPIIGTTSIPMVPTGTTNSIPPTLSTTTITGPTPTVGAVASATDSMIPTTVSSVSLSTKNEPSGTISSGTISADMETKCTQTKLDDELLLEPIMGCSASFNSATSCGSEYQKTTTSSNPSTTVEQNPKSISAEPKSGSAGSKSGSSGPKSGSVNEPTTAIGISEAAAGSNPAIATTSEQPSKSIGPTENNPGNPEIHHLPQIRLLNPEFLRLKIQNPDLLQQQLKVRVRSELGPVLPKSAHGRMRRTEGKAMLHL